MLLKFKPWTFDTCKKILPFTTRGWLCKSAPGGRTNKSGTVSSSCTLLMRDSNQREFNESNMIRQLPTV